MPIDIDAESVLTITQACEYLAERGFDKPKELTVRRWIWYGSNGRKLESVKLGHRVYTSKEALARFAAGDDVSPAEPEIPFDMGIYESSIFRSEDHPDRGTRGRKRKG